jgi:hypothetical protein
MGAETFMMNEIAARKISPNRIWILIFGIWLVFLSGVLNPLTGSPGVLQAVQLQRILNNKLTQIDVAENQLIALQEESTRLEKNPLTQEREIRRVLGYAAPSELIFDFSADEPAH